MTERQFPHVVVLGTGAAGRTVALAVADAADGRPFRERGSAGRHMSSGVAWMNNRYAAEAGVLRGAVSLVEVESGT